MQIVDYDYTGVSSALAASQVQTTKQAAVQQDDDSKVQKIKAVDTYEHVDTSDTPASAGIYDSTGKISGTGETEKQRSESGNEDSQSEEGAAAQAGAVQEAETSEAKPSGGAGAAQSGGSSSDNDDDEDSTTSKVVTINGVTYLETTTVKDGVKTVTRKELDSGNVEVEVTQES